MFSFGDKEWPGLAKLNEESGELVQVVGKLMMTHGDRRYWGGVDLRQRLVEEMADQAAAIGFVADHALTDDEIAAFAARREEKRALFERWHVEQARPDPLAEEIARRVREETEGHRRRHEETHRVLCERNGEIDRLRRENRALVRALGDKEPTP